MIDMRTISRITIAVAATAALCGCGVVDEVNARVAANRSLAALHACLAANPAAPQNCAGAHEAYEADMQQVNAYAIGPRRSVVLDTANQ